MRKVVVEVTEDPTHPDGGRAVILLRGVTSFPDRATFRLKSVETRGLDDPNSDEWPSGELQPLKIRQGDSGIELVVGPEIVDSPALIPGTLGVIEIRSAGLRGEFLWPSLRPTSRPRRRNLTVVKRPATASASSWTISAADQAVGSQTIHTAAQDCKPAPDASSAPNPPTLADETTAITALDHDTPWTATITQAASGNVVSFSAAREAMAGGERADQPQARGSDPRILHDAAADRQSSTSASDQPSPLLEQQPGRRRQILALASLAAIAISSGYLTYQIGSAPKASLDAIAASELPRPAEAASRPMDAAPPTDNEATAATSSQPPARAIETAAVEPERRTEPDQFPLQNVSVAEPSPQPSEQPQVTLRMRGGGFHISGVLKGFDGTRYLIETAAAGTLTMDASRFDCEGDSCNRQPAAIIPLDERPSPAKPDLLRVEGADALSTSFIPQLIGDYARSIGASVRQMPSGVPQVELFRLADSRGSELATIEIITSSSASALAAMARGAAQFALVDRPQLPTSDAQQTRSRQPPPTPQSIAPGEILLATDGVAVVSGSGSAPAALPIDRIARAMAGQITDWFEFGRQPGPIALYLPPDTSGTVETFVRQVMRPRGLEISRTAVRMSSDKDVAEAAARDQRALAIVSFAAMGNARPIGLETQCGLVVRPTTFAVKSGEYPLVRLLSLQTPAQLPQPSARGLLRLAKSSEAQAAVSSAHLIDTSLAVLSFEEQSERMAWAANAPANAFDAGELRRMIADLEPSVRLSMTFRYVPGTDELDQRSRRDVQRLAAALKQPELAGRTVLLAGFTDATGRFQSNISAGLKRAGQLRSSLLVAADQSLDPRLLVAKSYGPLAPVACAGQADSARLNRRVEVWVSTRTPQ